MYWWTDTCFVIPSTVHLLESLTVMKRPRSFGFTVVDLSDLLNHIGLAHDPILPSHYLILTLDIF